MQFDEFKTMVLEYQTLKEKLKKNPTKENEQRKDEIKFTLQKIANLNGTSNLKDLFMVDVKILENNLYEMIKFLTYGSKVRLVSKYQQKNKFSRDLKIILYIDNKEYLLSFRGAKKKENLTNIKVFLKPLIKECKYEGWADLIEDYPLALPYLWATLKEQFDLNDTLGKEPKTQLDF